MAEVTFAGHNEEVEEEKGMKARIVSLKELSQDRLEVGRPKTKLPMRFLLALRDEGLTLRQISDRTGIPKSTVGDTLKGRPLGKKRKQRKVSPEIEI